MTPQMNDDTFNRRIRVKNLIPAFAGMTMLLTAGFGLALLIIGGPIPLHAETSKGAGSSLFPFLKIPISARAVALGGTLGATDGDAGGIDTHMAGLASLERIDLQASFINHFEDSSLQAITAGFPIKSKGKPGIPLERMEGAEFPRDQWVIGVEYRSFKVSDDAFDENNHPLDEFDVKDQMIAVGLAYPISRKISVGLTGKTLNSKIQGKSTSASAIDAGFINKINSRLNFGLAFQNLGFQKKFSGSLSNSEYSLPGTARGSLSYRFNPWVLALVDVAAAQDEVIRKSGGVEWSLGKSFHVRGGVLHHTSLEFSGGVGLDINGPQKSLPPSTKSESSLSGKKPASNLSPMAVQILGRLSDKMIQAYLPTKLGVEKPTLAVLPFHSSEQASVSIHKKIHEALSQSNEFKTIDSKNETAFIISGKVNLSNDTYIINTRLIRMEDGETIAVERAEIAQEDLFEEVSSAQKKPTLGKISYENSSSNNSFTRVNISLDYGLTTHQELGLTHTLTLKILY
ncbi:MAG: hypothetical protein KCHDKBKB_00920 [Elusimicrobia bacterium]|nr:hypothetical protein [Elusimicrobiota bacterium]